jgi:hypothetical protein
VIIIKSPLKVKTSPYPRILHALLELPSPMATIYFVFGI